jgi:hypothetical protein
LTPSINHNVTEHLVLMLFLATPPKRKIIIQIRLIRIHNHHVHEQDSLRDCSAKSETPLILSARCRCPLGNCSIKRSMSSQLITIRGISGSSSSSGSGGDEPGRTTGSNGASGSARCTAGCGAELADGSGAGPRNEPSST